MHIKFPRLRRPRWLLNPHPSRKWQRWLVILPRFVRWHDFTLGRVLILPGWYETRVSITQRGRIYRDVGGDA